MPINYPLKPNTPPVLTPLLLILSVVAACLIPSCLFETTAPAKPIVMTRVGAAKDTVSPSPVLRFAVSSTLSDSSVDFNFSPATSADYSVFLNAARDTITLRFLNMLEGNTRYVLHLKAALNSEEGATLNPGQDSIVFFTSACEHEPNSSFALADTLFSGPIFGMLSMAADTDVYIVPATSKRKFYLSSDGARDTFMLFDSLQASITVESGSGTEDTITVPGTTRFPVYVKIFSYVAGTAGKYEFGVVQK
jgi:hypothetical protein